MNQFAKISLPARQVEADLVAMASVSRTGVPGLVTSVTVGR